MPDTFEYVRRFGNRVFFRALVPMGTVERARALMEMEECMRKESGEPIEVYLEPTMDDSKLRVRLRGVKGRGVDY